MAKTKLSADLSRHLKNIKESEMLDLIIEVGAEDSSSFLPDDSNLSRQERIAFRRENFAKQSAPVENAVQEEGGEVVDRAWINKTLKVRVPVKSVKKISEHQNIFNLDIPHNLEKD